MDTSGPVLHHCDSGPTNVVVDLKQLAADTSVGIIDWETAGYAPQRLGPSQIQDLSSYGITFLTGRIDPAVRTGGTEFKSSSGKKVVKRSVRQSQPHKHYNTHPY